MIVLAIETATPQVGVALAGPAGPIASIDIAEGRRHGEMLTPAIEAVCGYGGITLAEVDLVAVDVGPGLFTGLRVGLATARTLASALSLPSLGVTSTEILAAPHSGGDRAVATVVDIRRGEVAWALYRPSPAGAVEVLAPRVATPAQLALALGGLGYPVLAVGDGARRYACELGETIRGGSWTDHPSAAVLAELAEARAGQAGDPMSLLPVYLRDADVRIGWEQAPSRG